MMCLGPGFAGRCTPDLIFHSLVTLEVAISLADGFLALAEGRITYCPLVCLQLAAALWGLSLEDRATCAVMDTARKGSGTLTLVREPNLFQKLPGVLPGTGSEQEFLQANRLPAGPARLMDFYALAVLLLSAAVAGLTCRGTTATFFQYWTAVLLAGTPLAGAVAWSRPWCILSRRLQARGACAVRLDRGLPPVRQAGGPHFRPGPVPRGKRQNERREVLLVAIHRIRWWPTALP